MILFLLLPNVWPTMGGNVISGKKNVNEIITELALSDIWGPDWEDEFFQFSFTFDESAVIIGHEGINGVVAVDWK